MAKARPAAAAPRAGRCRPRELAGELGAWAPQLSKTAVRTARKVSPADASARAPASPHESAPAHVRCSLCARPQAHDRELARQCRMRAAWGPQRARSVPRQHWTPRARATAMCVMTPTPMRRRRCCRGVAIAPHSDFPSCSNMRLSRRHRARAQASEFARQVSKLDALKQRQGSFAGAESDFSSTPVRPASPSVPRVSSQSAGVASRPCSQPRCSHSLLPACVVFPWQTAQTTKQVSGFGTINGRRRAIPRPRDIVPVQ